MLGKNKNYSYLGEAGVKQEVGGDLPRCCLPMLMPRVIVHKQIETINPLPILAHSSLVVLVLAHFSLLNKEDKLYKTLSNALI